MAGGLGMKCVTPWSVQADGAGRNRRIEAGNAVVEEELGKPAKGLSEQSVGRPSATGNRWAKLSGRGNHWAYRFSAERS